MEVKVSDIINAYIEDPVTEKIWTIMSPEFGEYQGNVNMIVRGLYILNSFGAALFNHLAGCMNHVGYTICLENNDLYPSVG